MTSVGFWSTKLSTEATDAKVPIQRSGKFTGCAQQTTLPADELSIMKNSRFFWRKRSPCVARLPSQ